MFLPKELIVFFVSLVPITEMGAAIPVGNALGLSIYASVFWALLGNTILSILLLKILNPTVQIIFKYFPKLDQFIKNKFSKIHHKHNQNFNRIGLVLLPILIVVPIPGTGTYTMTTLAWLLDLPFWPSITAIFIGNIILSFLIAQITLGVSLIV